MVNFSIAIVFIASFSLLLALTYSFSTDNPTDRRILVLLDDLALKSSHSIFFSSLKARFGGYLDVAAILDFVDSGKDLIVAANATVSNLIRNIAAECGVDFDEDPSTVVIDHGSYAISGTGGYHTLIDADDFIQSDVLLDRFISF
ncbi:hypothetical protein SSX86_014749 [Deinandra increscens subsp. villosa]|uniref:Dolichyl-diphosphooligosaccharide--protein glycosyltransferase 48 kDa subunit n=1 Tax=Deinandra increscens subsp. villosa TaxID=3103831 RepID=A0AAP0D2H6_9ASTR